LESLVFGLLKKTADAKGRIGLAFGRDRIALAVVAGGRGRGQATLERCEVLPFDPVGGVEALSAALRAAALPRLPISTVLQSDDYQLALVEAPDVPPAELRAAIRWRIKDAIDIRVDAAVIDVFDVPAPSRGAQGRMMYAVAAQRSAIDRHAAALAAIGRLDVIDVPELCLRNLAAALPAAAGGVALLHLGESHATVVLTQGRTFFFARQMELHAAAGPAAGGAGAIPDVTSIVLELQRSLDYYERHFDQPPITRVAIAPAGQRAEVLALRLAQETGFEVAALDLNALLHCAVPVAAATQLQCLMAVAAALREERRSL
jgi:MSHA biogenesis protein MshI